MVKALFWGSVALIAYVWLGYPLLLWLAAACRRIGRRSGAAPGAGPTRGLGATRGPEGEWPEISVVVTARDEEETIRACVQSVLAADYPPERRHVIVASDGSRDRTEAIVEGFARQGVRLWRYPPRGKSLAQNDAVEAAAGEIVILTDADAVLEPQTLEALAATFRDHRIGVVSGECRYASEDAPEIGQPLRLYRRYDDRVRRLAADAGLLTHASGACMAFRKRCFEPLAPYASDDVGIPLSALRRGYRVAHQPRARAVLVAGTGSRGAEIRSRRRMVARNIWTLWRNRELLNPLRHPAVAVGLVSSKILRWLMPVLLGFVLATSLSLAELPLYRYALAAQLAFYGAAGIGAALHRRGRARPTGLLALPHYVLVESAGLALGLVDALRGTPRASYAGVHKMG